MNVTRLVLVVVEFGTDLLHVQPSHLSDEVRQRRLRQCASLEEHPDRVAVDRHGRQCTDADLRRQLSRSLCIDLAEHNVWVLFGGGLLHRGKRSARTTPGRPEVEDHDPIAARDLLKVLVCYVYRCHLWSSLKQLYWTPWSRYIVLDRAGLRKVAATCERRSEAVSSGAEMRIDTLVNAFAGFSVRDQA